MAVGVGLDRFIKELRAKVPYKRPKTRKFFRKFHKEGRRQGRAGVMFPLRMRFDPEGTITKEIVTNIWKGIEDSVEQEIIETMKAAIRRQKPSFRTVIEVKR